MKVLFCAYEVAPFFKRGGLGDVAGSLPKALKKLGVDIKVVMPGYRSIVNQLICKSGKVNSKPVGQEVSKSREGIFGVEFDGEEEEVRISKSVLPGSQVPIYFLENKNYLSSLEDGKEKYEQFAFFSKAIMGFLELQVTSYPGKAEVRRLSTIPTKVEDARLCAGSREYRDSVGDPRSKHRDKLQVDLLHLNDWHTALVALLQKLQPGSQPAILLTIHSFSHQGIAPLDVLQKLGISRQASRVLDWDTSDENLEMLMEGIIYSDIVNTVSPKYAQEILEPEFIGRLSEVLKGKEARVKGVLNGIDDDVWNPETDRLIEVNYGLGGRTCPDASVGVNTPQSGVSLAGPTSENGGFSSGSDLSPAGSLFLAGRPSDQNRILKWREGKKANKLALQKELGFEINAKKPLLAFIGRLAKGQKGVEILYQALQKLLPKEEFQFVLLGTGSQDWEDKLKVLDRKGLIRIVLRFDEALAHRIYAGADFLLVPSKFEPCGLVQMIAMRYGTLPIVRKTGGLADTVKKGINGFVFEEYSSKALVQCIEQVLCKFEMRFSQETPLSRGNSKFEIMINKAMSEDFSWDRSAGEYLRLYKKALEIRNKS